MTDKRIFLVEHKNPNWRRVVDNAVAAVREWAEGGDLALSLSDVTRTLDQNSALWPALRDFARHVQWPVTQADGTTRPADEQDVKDVLTAAFEQETRMAPGLRGGWVMLGARTSKFGKRKMADFLTFVNAEGNERGVQWSRQAIDKFDEYGVQWRRAA